MSKTQLVFAVHEDGSEVRLYSCRYFGPTNFKPSRWKFTPTNMAGDKCGKAVFMPYDHQASMGAPAQLASFLGDGWQCLGNLETFYTIKEAFKPNEA